MEKSLNSNHFDRNHICVLNQLTFQKCVAPVNLQTPDKRQQTNGKWNCVKRILVFHFETNCGIMNQNQTLNQIRDRFVRKSFSLIVHSTFSHNKKR